MASYLKAEIRVPLAKHQVELIQAEFPKMREGDKREYLCLILGTDNILVDRIEPVFEPEIVPTFCGDINVHETHDSFDPHFGNNSVLRCPGMTA